MGSANNNKLKESTESSTKNIKALKKALNFGGAYLAIKRVGGAMWNLAQANVDMIEANNLFEVSMGKVVDEYGNLDESASEYYIKAMQFQDKMNEKLATNKAELKQYQAMYFSMLKSQGINKDASYFMSENLTKAGYDIASLYNLSVEDAMNKLKSGLSGQVESLRKIGIDVSESALAKVLNQVGIERSVQQLSYAEKEVARYIAILEQAGQAQGDFAKTFEQPANQIRVLKNQFIELKQVAGAFIVNTFGGVLVWLNAIIMTIKAVLKAFASLFGWDLNSGGADLSESIGIDNVSTGLGNASKKAKELKKQLMGFDEINNIDKPNNSSGGGIGGVPTGVDDKLLKNLKEWDNRMDSISGKAQEISDRMMRWLGFERDDDGGWKLKEGYQNIEKIFDLLKLFAGLFIFTKAVGIISKLGTAFKTAGTIIKGIGTAIAGSKLVFAIQAVAGGAATIGEGFAYAFPWVAKIGGAFGTLAGALGISATALAGIVGAVVALAGVIIYLNVSPAVKQLDIFKGASDKTRQKLEGLMDEFNYLDKELKQQDWGDKIITDQDVKNTESSLKKIVGAVKDGLKTAKEEAISGFNDTLKESMGEELFKEMYDKTTSFYDNQSKLIDDKQKQILDIQKKASKEKRSLTEEEVATIDKLYDEMKTTTVKTLSESEEEAVLILGRMSQNAKALSAEQASAIIKESIKTRDETIKNAQDTYTKQVEQAKKLRDAGQITEEEYQKWIDASAKARDERIADAEEMHQKVYDEFKAENEDIAKYIDSDTGEIKSKWSYFWGEVGKTISTWWTNDVAPWFTKEKWQELAQKAQEGLKEKYNELVEKFKPIKDWFTKNIAPWFTKEKWQKLGEDAIKGVKEKLKLDQIKFKFPHITWSANGAQASGVLKKALELLNLPTQMPKLSVSWYASGGMPDMGEIFVARESGPEMVGRIGSKTTVANNDQIVTAIKQGVYEAVTSAMPSGSTVRLDVRADEGIIVKKASEGFREYVMQTGELPFPVPV